MKKNRIYIVWIIVLTILIGFSIYNYNHPVKNTGKIISSGTVVGFNEEFGYDENSEYITNYTMDLETKNNGNITINLKNDELKKYKAGDKLNYYEEKGEYIITTEKANDYNKNLIWIILPILEFIGIVFCVVKIIKNKNE